MIDFPAPTRFRACWVTQPPSGLAVTPARWTRRVSSSMTHSTSSRRSHTVSTVQQVAGEDPSGLLAQERPPGAGGSPWCRVEPMAATRGTDRDRRDPKPDVLQVALAALGRPRWGSLWPGGRLAVGSPGPAVAGPSGGAGRSRRQRSAAGASPAASPAAPTSTTSRSGAGRADRGEQRPVGGLQPESSDLAAQDGELVAEHQELKVPGGVTAGHQPKQLGGTAQREVGELG
jgi:hypothetical protein